MKTLNTDYWKAKAKSIQLAPAFESAINSALGTISDSDFSHLHYSEADAVAVKELTDQAAKNIPTKWSDLITARDVRLIRENMASGHLTDSVTGFKLMVASFILSYMFDPLSTESQNRVEEGLDPSVRKSGFGNEVGALYDRIGEDSIVHISYKNQSVKAFSSISASEKTLIKTFLTCLKTTAECLKAVASVYFEPESLKLDELIASGVQLTKLFPAGGESKSLSYTTLALRNLGDCCQAFSLLCDGHLLTREVTTVSCESIDLPETLYAAESGGTSFTIVDVVDKLLRKLLYQNAQFEQLLSSEVNSEKILTSDSKSRSEGFSPDALTEIVNGTVYSSAGVVAKYNGMLKYIVRTYKNLAVWYDYLLVQYTKGQVLLTGAQAACIVLFCFGPEFFNSSDWSYTCKASAKDVDLTLVSASYARTYKPLASMVESIITELYDQNNFSDLSGVSICCENAKNSLRKIVYRASRAVDESVTHAYTGLTPVFTLGTTNTESVKEESLDVPQVKVGPYQSITDLATGLDVAGSRDTVSKYGTVLVGIDEVYKGRLRTMMKTLGTVAYPVLSDLGDVVTVGRDFLLYCATPPRDSDVSTYGTQKTLAAGSMRVKYPRSSGLRGVTRDELKDMDVIDLWYCFPKRYVLDSSRQLLKDTQLDDLIKSRFAQLHSASNSVASITDSVRKAPSYVRVRNRMGVHHTTSLLTKPLRNLIKTRDVLMLPAGVDKEKLMSQRIPFAVDIPKRLSGLRLSLSWLDSSSRLRDILRQKEPIPSSRSGVSGVPIWEVKKPEHLTAMYCLKLVLRSDVTKDKLGPEMRGKISAVVDSIVKQLELNDDSISGDATGLGRYVWGRSYARAELDDLGLVATTATIPLIGSLEDNPSEAALLEALRKTLSSDGAFVKLLDEINKSGFFNKVSLEPPSEDEGEKGKESEIISTIETLEWTDDIELAAMVDVEFNFHTIRDSVLSYFHNEEYTSNGTGSADGAFYTRRLQYEEKTLSTKPITTNMVLYSDSKVVPFTDAVKDISSILYDGVHRVFEPGDTVEVNLLRSVADVCLSSAMKSQGTWSSSLLESLRLFNLPVACQEVLEGIAGLNVLSESFDVNKLLPSAYPTTIKWLNDQASQLKECVNCTGEELKDFKVSTVDSKKESKALQILAGVAQRLCFVNAHRIKLGKFERCSIVDEYRRGVCRMIASGVVQAIPVPKLISDFTGASGLEEFFDPEVVNKASEFLVDVLNRYLVSVVKSEPTVEGPDLDFGDVKADTKSVRAAARRGRRVTPEDVKDHATADAPEIPEVK